MGLLVIKLFVGRGRGCRYGVFFFDLYFCIVGGGIEFFKFLYSIGFKVYIWVGKLELFNGGYGFIFCY